MPKTAEDAIFLVRFAARYGIFFCRTEMFLNNQLSREDKETNRENIASCPAEMDRKKIKL